MEGIPPNSSNCLPKFLFGSMCEHYKDREGQAGVLENRINYARNQLERSCIEHDNELNKKNSDLEM